MRFSIESCVVKFSSFGQGFDGLWNKEWHEPKLGYACRCQNRRISGRGSRTMRLRLMVTEGGGHDVYPGSGPLYGGNTLLPA